MVELRRAVATKAPLRVQFLLTFLGGESKKFDFYSFMISHLKCSQKNYSYLKNNRYIIIFFIGSASEDRNSLEDVLFAEDNFVDFQDGLDDHKFFVALRLSPRPEQLVKGYEFQMLNK